MRTALDVLFQVDLAVRELDFAATYARYAPSVDPECWVRNQQAIANKIEAARDMLDSIENKIKIKEVNDAKAA